MSHLPGRAAAAVITSLCIFVLTGCGGSSPSSSSGSPPAANSFPQFSQVILVVEENHSYSEVIGNSSMPYLNSLASTYGLATQYFANSHPSIGNYFMLTTGQIITTDDAFTGTLNVDNVVRELTAAGKTWKSYAESLPAQGYTGGDQYPYGKNHNPFAYLTDVLNSSTQTQNLVPFTQFSSDLANGQLPNFSFIAPNLLDDAHDGTLPAADGWLQQNIAPLIASSGFQSNGLLIIVFDESDMSDAANGGGHVAAVIVSPKAQRGHQSTTLYQHQSTLRLILHSLGVTAYPGAAANAPEMSEFF